MRLSARRWTMSAGRRGAIRVALISDLDTLPGSRMVYSDIGAIMWSHIPLSMIQHRALAHDDPAELFYELRGESGVLVGRDRRSSGGHLPSLPRRRGHVRIAAGVS